MNNDDTFSFAVSAAAVSYQLCVCRWRRATARHGESRRGRNLTRSDLASLRSIFASIDMQAVQITSALCDTYCTLQHAVQTLGAKVCAFASAEFSAVVSVACQVSKQELVTRAQLFRSIDKDTQPEVDRPLSDSYPTV